MIELTLNEYWQRYYEPLDYGQEQSLKRSLQAGVTKEPLYYWVNPDGKNELLDGHHRLKLAKQLGLEMEVEKKEFASAKEAELFVIRTQTTRRNLSPYDREQLVKRAVELQIAIEGKTKTEAVKDVAATMGISEATAWRDVKPKSDVQQFFEDKKVYERDLERVRNKEVEKLKQRAIKGGYTGDEGRLEAEWEPIEIEIQKQFAEVASQLEAVAEGIQTAQEAEGGRPASIGGKRGVKKSTRDKAARRNTFKKALSLIGKLRNEALYFWEQNGCGDVAIEGVEVSLKAFQQAIEDVQALDAKAAKFRR